MYLLKRMSLNRTIVAATSLLQEIYVITENSDTVDVYYCHRPYQRKGSVTIPGMNPTDIATSYADVCVYLLDSNNACLRRIHRNLKTTECPLDVSPGESLKSMSITERGVIVVVKSGNKVMMYDPMNGKTEHLLLEGVSKEGKSVVHATEIGKNRLLACHDTQTFVYDLESTEVCSCIGPGGSHIALKNSKCAIIADESKQLVWMLDIEKWQITDERGGMENPKYVHYGMENGLMLVAWLNYLDVYSFEEIDIKSHLAATETEAPQAIASEAAVLQSDVLQGKSDAPTETTGIPNSHFWRQGYKSKFVIL